ncbi:type VI secretion system baseplate subunit TssG [Rugamonas sp. CCM 8940]|uniref:type VI secretion system baseplate subunit TssG n=1 Tax=Rugamonas sp. CCM 8940 TaxID=2765359 RepID=UPI0018F400AA|nr:type VI secretion system baseplate subunit TssG [Rugamonas sp. CCM 8940]MBJ7314339.1 type VI secretion system baseplate subunit TssG [Rugamonas sp. CCM 8940]
MPTPKWRHPSSLIRRAIEHPQQFDFFQLARVFDLWLRGQGHTLERFVRFRNSVSLRFPPSQIEALSVAAEVAVDTDAALQAALDRGQLRNICITPAFMGFLGVCGVLPYCYTNSVAARIHFNQNEGARAFLDVFSNRSLTLFYRAWEKCRVEYRRDAQGRDGFLPLQLALAGARPRPRGDGALVEEVVAHYAALIRHRPVSGAVLVGILNEYFGLPFALEQFVGAWETLRPEERSRLGGANRKLGSNAMIGQRYWRRDLCVRLRLGPLARADFDRFLPGSSGQQALTAMLALFAIPNVLFALDLILRAQDVLPVRLGSHQRIGHGAFLVRQPSTVDRNGKRYHITL